MNIYEIDTTIAAFLADATDPETGELPEAEQFWEELTRLHLLRDTTLEDLLLEVKNLNAESAAIKTEATALQERAAALKKRADRIKNNVSYYLNGDGFSTNRVEVSWRKSTSVEIYDEAAFRKFVDDGHEIYVRSVECPPDKDQIKGALKHGLEVAGARLVEKNNMSIK